jgi:hypothetical protein
MGYKTTFWPFFVNIVRIVSKLCQSVDFHIRIHFFAHFLDPDAEHERFQIVHPWPLTWFRDLYLAKGINALLTTDAWVSSHRAYVHSLHPSKTALVELFKDILSHQNHPKRPNIKNESDSSLTQ